MSLEQVQSESQGKAEEAEQLRRLLAGDDEAFAALVERHHAAMRRVAMHYVRDEGTADDVVQEAWLGVLRGLSHFEARASLKTWIFRILINRARTIARREARAAPHSGVSPGEPLDGEPSEPAHRFKHPAAPGHWSEPPHRFEETPEDELLSAERRHLLEEAIASLPPVQREVITLRDVEGWSADEVCNVLDLTEVNQRVLLHRARATVRRALEQYFTPD